MKAEKDSKKQLERNNSLDEENDEFEVKKEGGQRINSDGSKSEVESSLDKDDDSEEKEQCTQSDEHCSSQSSEDSEECEDDFHKEMKAQHIQDKFFNRFFYKVDAAEEFKNDF